MRFGVRGERYGETAADPEPATKEHMTQDVASLRLKRTAAKFIRPSTPVPESVLGPEK